MFLVLTRPQTGNMNKKSTESFSQSGVDFDSDLDESNESIFELGEKPSENEHPHHHSNHADKKLKEKEESN